MGRLHRSPLTFDSGDSDHVEVIQALADALAGLDEQLGGNHPLRLRAHPFGRHSARDVRGSAAANVLRSCDRGDLLGSADCRVKVIAARECGA